MRASPGEIATKLARVRQAAKDAGCAGVVLRSSTALTWLLDGARVHVSLAGPPVALAVVSEEAVDLVAPVNEADRLLEEEVGGTVAAALGLRVHRVPWHARLHPSAVPGADVDALVDEDVLAPQLQAARASLLPAEESRYRSLAGDIAREVTQVLERCRPDERECDLAARLTAAVAYTGSEPLVVLVAGQSRLRVRHPLPTSALLGARTMAVVCARRHGMIVNLTRWVNLAPAHPWDTAADEAIAEVEADLFDRLRPGVALTDLLATARAAYGRHGFAADEWEKHHQGGPAGYAGRDPRLAPQVPGRLVRRQALTLNPTAPGTKIEDTVLLLGGGRLDVLTTDPRWPTRLVRGRERPAALQLG